MGLKTLLALVPAAIIGSAEAKTELPPSLGLPTLTCQDRTAINSHGTFFYMCYSDVFTSPANPGHIGRFYAMIDLLGRVKEYEEKTFGFSPTANYREYRPGNDEDLSRDDSVDYKLYVVPKFMISVEPETRIYLSSATDYHGAISAPAVIESRRDNLQDEEAYYKAHGFDVYRRVILDFSSGDASQPGCSINDELLKDSAESAARKAIHEDYHYNRRFYGDYRYVSRIEESAATVVGRVGSLEFVEDTFGTDSEFYEKAVKAFDEWKGRAEFTTGYYEELSELYAMEIPSDEMARKKAEILERAANDWKEITGVDEVITNAFIMRDLPYTWLFPEINAVYEAHPEGGDFIRIMSNIPVDEEKAVEYLNKFSACESSESFFIAPETD